MTGHTNSCTITISRVEGGEEINPVHISCSIAVSSNLTWHAVVKGKVLSSNVGHFSALPQTIVSLRDVLTVLECVDSLTLCVGNRDKKFHPLIAARKGSFRNQSGTLILCILDPDKISVGFLKY